GNGTWCGWSDEQQPGQGKRPNAQGGLLFIPPDADLAQVLAGNSSSELSSLQPRLGFPADISGVAFGQFDGTSGNLASGVAMTYQSAALDFQVYSGGAAQPSPRIRLGEGGTIIDGKLTLNGRLDPWSVEFTKRSPPPVPGTDYGLWVSDGSEAGTTDGGLYYDRAGSRVRLDSGSGGTTIPTGSLVPWAGSESSVPSGWLLCNGQAVSRTTYSDLFTAISTTYGVGDGSTTF